MIVKVIERYAINNISCAIITYIKFYIILLDKTSFYLILTYFVAYGIEVKGKEKGGTNIGKWGKH